MSTPKKYELLKHRILRMCPEGVRREVIFFGPERRRDSMKISVSNVGSVNIDRIQRDLRGCQVFMRSQARGGSRLEIYVPCKQAPIAIRRGLIALTLIAWSTLTYLCFIVKIKMDSDP